jgi:hypothetical protein
MSSAATSLKTSRNRRGRIPALAALGLLFCLPVRAQEPTLGEPPLVEPSPEIHRSLSASQLASDSAGGTWIDTSSRSAVRYFYKNQLTSTVGTASGWNGAIAGCNAGTTSLTYQEAARSRYNWFRAMAGIPAGVRFDATNNQNDQQAALMMSANGQLSHTPPSSWTCYTSAGAQAAGQSNLCLGYSLTQDPGCVAAYIQDSGSNNTAVGHRRWILYPQTRVSGTGDVTPAFGSGYSHANDLTAWDSNVFGPRPATRQAYVAWPPPGYVPYQNVYARWSFAYPAANFSGATVSMTRNGTSVSSTLETVQNGYGENTLVWVPALPSPYPAPSADESIVVNVNNVLIGGAPQNFSYTVTVFHPDQPAGATTPSAVFRNSSGSIVFNAYGSPSFANGGGVFASDPSGAQSFGGDTYAVARDTWGSLWANVYNATTGSWGSWSFGGGVTVGTPVIALATNNTAYICARDAYNSYWLVSYTPAGGFGAWTYLAGVFSTDPVMAAAPDGSVYIIGKDTYNSLWSGRYVPGTGFQGWLYGAGIVKGKPSVSVGTDGVAYVAVRDNFDALWMARVQGDTWLGWSFGGGVLSADPRIAAPANGTVYAAVRDSGGGVWYRGYLEGSAGGWQNWTLTGGVLQELSAGGAAGVLYIAGREANGNLWWFRSAGSLWTPLGNGGAAAGPPAASPR